MPLPPEVVQSFPEEIRGEASWEKFDDVGGVAKSYIEQQKMNGRSIAIPDEKAAPEDLEKWKGEHLPKLAARGIIELPPSKMEDYKLPTIEGYAPDKTATESFIKDVAFANKMTPKQVEAIMKFDAQRSAAAMKDMFLPADAAEAEFKAMMGEDYEEVNGKVTAAMKALGDDQPAIISEANTTYVVTMKDGKPVGKLRPFNQSALGKAFYETFGALTMEDHVTGTSPDTSMSEDSLREKMQAIRDDPKTSGQKKGELLEPLYKQLTAIEKKKGVTA